MHYLILEEDHNRLCCYFMYWLHCAFYPYFKVHSSYLSECLLSNSSCVKGASSHSPGLSIAPFSFVLDLTSCGFAQQHAVQVCSLGAIGYTIQPRCVIGYAICVGALCDVHTMTKWPNNAFSDRMFLFSTLLTPVGRLPPWWWFSLKIPGGKIMQINTGIHILLSETFGAKLYFKIQPLIY